MCLHSPRATPHCRGVLAPDVQRLQILKALAWPRPCLEFLAGESERSTTRLSLPSRFFYVLLVPYPNPWACFPLQSLADGRDLMLPSLAAT